VEIISSAEDLFVNFRVREQIYAFNANQVDSIVELKQELTPLPNSSACVLGLVSMRGRLLPVIDFRQMLGVVTVEQEHAEFVGMLHERQKDHVRWVEQLEKSVREGVPFTLATDHHKCAFGKWYDQYKAPNHAVAIAMKKIDRPHQAIHHSALDCFAHGDDPEKQEQILQEVTIPAMRSILEDIDQMIEQYSATKRRICIILSGKADNLALLVDEITSVERLQDIQPVEAMTENELVSGYASSRDQKHILLLESGRVMDALRRSQPLRRAE